MEGIVEYNNENGEKKILRNISKIGEGGIGVVYKALLDGFGEVAVKYQINVSEDDITSALLEYRKSPLLSQHSITVRRIIVAPHIKSLYPMLNDPAVSVTFSNIENYKIIFIYDLAVGMELFEVIQLQQESGVPFTLSTLKQYSLQLLEGIIEIRNAEIIHRDIKPENIMLHNGNLKFIDFGMICQPVGENICNGVRGTPFFISPKILKNQNNLNSDDWYNSDVYAIGITIMNLLGEIPFEEYDEDEDPLYVILEDNSVDIIYELIQSKIESILTREGYKNFAPLILGLTAQNPITPEDAIDLLKNIL